MRLSSLLIQKYGNFDRAELRFDTAPGRLNLVLAPNGAGKSVLRRAFHDLLFGIPLQSDMRFRFDYPGMHLHAEAISADGARYAFGWQRRQGRTFPNAADDPSASRWLTELLAAITPRQVEMLFALDTERLRSGGRELAAGDGTLGNALLSGTGELASARALRRSLDERRSAIWERGKSSRPLNGSLSRLATAAKQRRDAVQTPKSLAALQLALAQARARNQVATAEAEAAQLQLKRLNRIELTRGPLTLLSEAKAWLADHADAPVLPDGIGEALVQARHETSLAADRLETARMQLGEIQRRNATIARDEPADAAERELAQLPGALGDAVTKRRDSAARSIERTEALAEIAAALRDIGSVVPPDQAGSLIPTLPAVAAARERISQHVAATTTLHLAQSRLEKALAALAQLDGEAAGSPIPTPPGLAPLLTEIRRSRDPLDHAVELAQTVRQAAAIEAASLARVPGWAGSAEDLAGLAPSSEPIYERFAQALSDATTRLSLASKEHDRLAAQRAQWQASLATLRRQPLPDAAALSAARAARDHGWQLIYAHAFGAAPDAVAERRYTGDAALPIVFERHLRAADALADARIDQIARVEQASRLVADITGSEQVWVASAASVAEAARQHATVASQWRDVCQLLRLPADATLRDVLALLAAREDAIEARSASQMARAAQAELTALHFAWAHRLAGLLDVSDAPLAALLPIADAQLAATDLARKDAMARDARRIQAATEDRAAAAALAAATQVLAGWQSGWAQTLHTLGRPADEMPAVTERVLARLGELERHHQTAASLQVRIEGMHTDIAAFSQHVAAMAARLGVPAYADTFATAEALIARREAAQRQASIAEEASRALATATKWADAALGQHRESTATLAAVLASCGAIDAAAAERHIAAARERTRQETARDSAESRLRVIGGGAAFELLAAELAALPLDLFEVERQAAETTMTRARQEESAAAVSLAELEARYRADAAATGAIEAAESEASIAAEAGRLLDEYLLLRITSGMLGRALERVEESAGVTGVQRIATAFEAITNGDWTIRPGENAKGETLLLALQRAANEPVKHIDQLSEGTRDQLYLALRLVAIESHVAAAPPLPFIADDILQTFDDARAHAAMQALIGLSHHVQVIVLTHHPHLLEVAKGLPVNVQHL